MSKKSKYWFIGIATTLVLVVVTAYIINRSRKSSISCDSSVLYLGDSHTAGSWSYADKVMKHCNSTSSKKIAKVGAKTSWMREQLETELKNKKYNLVVILGGSNDIFALSSIDKAKENMNKMLELISSSGAKSVVINPPSKKFYSGANDKQKSLIKSWTQFLKSHEQPIGFVNFEDLTQEQSVFAPDMVHVNSAGHKLLSDKFIEKFNLT